ncbi:hypothetical protein A3A14_01155 [Candidatus Daviesbacteria bacterium RIFCSPLOWO2_01_FULL_43_38]|uniref:Uncharacterized protein n=1 Tax=Candidatus Daviesbacteria bacterium RIFCSPHIGHO2_12_FULL_43_11 TaxID=1797780 RepID=A0A1F5K316_9BACT|nr:MAG: hypothetical protein A2874_01180 [Candidatus Daviesbacteria bacterium RIFCSPHIGHO2_01_FULL_43_17]OGE35195.1 MAG: hypothetical protein A3E45_02840 [Candidatus Daviesbacteria bacterium RIFCSPHIGHO2_12_FULL_43_11]OGE63384.1 MAG: hypothetical protein A3A14_01155 [Candidatus Daviesbacteria bacterium RIFCSPLOWO2_01_FULL_43_38]OGE70843.1 MAG: hypothetical protein A3J21_00505 [Candidatus Daviesbacteria bacterium RIFCSPLOWO2_02_FULL_43_11]
MLEKIFWIIFSVIVALFIYVALFFLLLSYLLDLAVAFPTVGSLLYGLFIILTPIILSIEIYKITQRLKSK